MASAEIDVIATLAPLPGRFNEVVEAFNQLADHVHNNEPGTIIYYAMKPEDKDEIIVIERYKDDEAVKVHVESEQYKTFFGKAKLLLQGPAEIKTCSYLAGFLRRAFFHRSLE